jgi:ATP-binding protein involved in chromosome partitioning
MNITKITQLVGLFQPNGWLKNLADSNVLENISENNGCVDIKIRLPFPSLTFASEVESKLQPKIALLNGVDQVTWDISLDVATLARCNQAPAIQGVKNVIAVASGKGGVGKSTTTVNIALALAKMGAKVGIMDADIYGPSIPLMLGVTDARPESYDGNTMQAINAHGLAVNSIGFIALQDQAMIWRGPMASKALLQLIGETHWGELDYLFIDMPPGTGDIQLTLSENVPVTGALIISTPQDVALADAAKGISMFRQVKVPVLGVVENMSTHICSNCGHEEAIFGTGGVAKMVQRFDTECIAQMPLHIDLRADIDAGTPTVVARPDSAFTALYSQLANDVVAKMFFETDTISTEIPIKLT